MGLLRKPQQNWRCWNCYRWRLRTLTVFHKTFLFLSFLKGWVIMSRPVWLPWSCPPCHNWANVPWRSLNTKLWHRADTTSEFICCLLSLRISGRWKWCNSRQQSCFRTALFKSWYLAFFVIFICEVLCTDWLNTILSLAKSLELATLCFSTNYNLSLHLTCINAYNQQSTKKYSCLKHAYLKLIM